MERSTGIAAAVFVVVGGLVHLQLWRSGYRAIPYTGIGAMVAFAVLLVASRRPRAGDLPAAPGATMTAQRA